MCVVVLPSVDFGSGNFVCFDLINLMSGRLHRVVLIITLVLPSVVILFYSLYYMFFQMSGRLHREVDILYTLVLPSLNRNHSFCFSLISCRGDYTG